MTARYLLEFLGADLVWVPDRESDSLEELRDSIPASHVGTPYQIFDRHTGKRRKVFVGSRRNTMGRWLR